VAQRSRTIPPLAITASLVVAACSALVGNSLDPNVTPPPAATVASPSPSAGPSQASSPTPDISPAVCTDFFTPPPYDAFRPVPGISVRAIDKTHFEIANTTSRTYYIGVTSWDTEDNLVCGRGVIDHSNNGGRLRPGRTVQRGGGSTPEVPLTVSIWANPCGEGCYRKPIGQYVVPLSSIEPPTPLAS
jgi:hypothetical protein